MTEQLEFKFDCQMLIAGGNLDEDEIFDYITENLEGDSLLAVGDEDLIKSTSTPINLGKSWNTQQALEKSTT